MNLINQSRKEKLFEDQLLIPTFDINSKNMVISICQEAGQPASKLRIYIHGLHHGHIISCFPRLEH